MRLKIKKKWKISLAVLVGVILTATATLAVKEQTKPAIVEEVVPVLSYGQQARIDYRVYLKPNSLYPENPLNPGKVYVTKFVDYLNTVFSYNFTCEEASVIRGRYDIVAVMAATAGKDNTQVWERRFVLQPEKSFEAKGGSVSLQDNIPLRVADYNAFVRQVAEEADLNANETKLVVYWNVWVEAITDSGSVKEQIGSTMVIPLGEKYFQVSGELNQDKPGTLTGVRQVPAGVNKSVVIACGLVALGCLAVLGLLFFCSSEPKEERDTVRKTVDRITKKYGDRLAVIEGDWPIAWENGIVMKSIEDLVRIADEVSKPIICRPSATDKPPVYFVVDEANVYLYKINDQRSSAGDTSKMMGIINRFQRSNG